jgi:hypothetical protein
MSETKLVEKKDFQLTFSEIVSLTWWREFDWEPASTSILPG